MFRLGEEEAELKLEKAEIVETTEKTDKICDKIISEMTGIIFEAFLHMSKEGYEETSLVEHRGTQFAQILDSICVVRYAYSEYMMRRELAQSPSFMQNSDSLKLMKNEDGILCENKDGTFFCKLLPYEEEAPGVNCFYLYEVEVEKKERNKGIATACLRELFALLAAEGPVTIYLQVGSYNEPAVHLYQKLGFEISEELCYYAPEEAAE